MPRITSRNVYTLELTFAGCNIAIECQGQAYKTDKEAEWKWDDMDWEVCQTAVMETAEWADNCLSDDEKRCYGIEGIDGNDLNEYILEWANQEAPEEWERLRRIKRTEDAVEWKPRF
jgi:hypothetical protein